MSLRLSSRAICNLRSSPRLRRSSCRGQWDCNNITVQNKASRPGTGRTKSEYALLQRKIGKQPGEQLFFYPSSVAQRVRPPAPTSVASLVWESHGGAKGAQALPSWGKGTLILKCFFPQNENGFIILSIEAPRLPIKYKSLRVQKGIRKRVKITYRCTLLLGFQTTDSLHS